MKIYYIVRAKKIRFWAAFSSFSKYLCYCTVAKWSVLKNHVYSWRQKDGRSISRFFRKCRNLVILALLFNRKNKTYPNFINKTKFYISRRYSFFTQHPRAYVRAPKRERQIVKVPEVFTVYLNPTKTILALKPSPTSSSSFHLWFRVGIRLQKHLITWLLIIWFSDHGHILNTGLKSGIQILC